MRRHGGEKTEHDGCTKKKKPDELRKTSVGQKQKKLWGLEAPRQVDGHKNKKTKKGGVGKES